MEVDKFATVRFFLAWCLLATTAIALAGCRGAGAFPEAGNATVARRCHGGECLIAYRQPEVELMAVPDPEHALGSLLAAGEPIDISKATANPNEAARCGRNRPGRYTSCTTQKGSNPRYSPYYRKGY